MTLNISTATRTV